MAERTPASLLSLAIAASVAVLPIMLGIVLLVAVIRPSQREALPAAFDMTARYLSVRQVAALKTFEQAVVRRESHDARERIEGRDARASSEPREASKSSEAGDASSEVREITAPDVMAGIPACRAEWGPAWRSTSAAPAERVATQLGALDDALRRFSERANTRVEHPVALDAQRWFAAARAALANPLEAPGYAGQRFQVGCADLAAALGALVRADARMLDAFAWRGTEGARAMAAWRPEQMMAIAPHQLARRNPWNGVAGCVYLGMREGSAAASPMVSVLGSPRVCALPAMRGASAPAEPVVARAAIGDVRASLAAVGDLGTRAATAATLALQDMRAAVARATGVSSISGASRNATSTLGASTSGASTSGTLTSGVSTSGTSATVAATNGTSPNSTFTSGTSTGVTTAALSHSTPRTATSPTAAAAHSLIAAAGEPVPDLALDDARWMVPPSLQAMLQPLESLRQPSGSLYRLYTEGEAAPAAPRGGYRYGSNRIVLDGTSVDAGFSVDVTIDPALQALAQKTVACYTGRQDVCGALGVHRAEDKGQPIGHKLLEAAMVRMAAVAVIDVASGRIEALAGALSPCTRQEFDGPGRDAGCDRRLPFPVRYRPDALLNPAVFHDAMPASTIKPIMAAAFFADRDVGRRWLAAERSLIKPGALPAPDSLRGQLMRSDSARFLDRMFCSDKNFADCGRPWEVQAMADAFGWNAGCREPRVDCGKVDLLFGRPVDATAEGGAVSPMSTPVAFGRLMSAPNGTSLAAPMHLAPRIPLPPSIVSRCAAGPDGHRRSKDDWEKCRGGAVVDVVAEGWGQGHARSSALGVAGMMATLAAAANGQSEIHRPHLVEAIRGAGAGESARLKPAALRWGLADARPNTLPQEAAQVILDGLSYSHRGGTARTACEEVFDAKSCKGIGWIAGKTGTPSFPSDGIGLDQLARLCRDPAQRAASAACSSLRPYKWYVAAYRPASGTGSGGTWTKAIAVLTERNWIVSNGQVHGAGDHGPNPSAEIALQIVGRQLGVIPGAAP